MPMEIHSTAVIEPGAELGCDVVVGPHAVIGSRVRIGDRTQVGPHVVINGDTRIGADCQLVAQAHLGGPPQDTGYGGEPTMLRIGDRTVIREFVTVSRGSPKGGALTVIGDDCMLMACSHVGHDCELDDRVILGNNVMLAGHVRVGTGANISGGTGCHQFVTVGSYVFVGGMTRCPQDIPPFVIFEGQPGRARGINTVGLSRAGFAASDIAALRSAFRKIFRSDLPRAESVKRMQADPVIADVVRQLLEALEQSARGPGGRFRETLRAHFARLGRERLDGASDTR